MLDLERFTKRLAIQVHSGMLNVTDPVSFSECLNVIYKLIDENDNLENYNKSLIETNRDRLNIIADLSDKLQKARDGLKDIEYSSNSTNREEHGHPWAAKKSYNIAKLTLEKIND